MPKGNPNLAQVQGRGRKKVTDRFFIRLDDKHGVTTDKYNITLCKVYANQGKVVPVGFAYYGTFLGVVQSLRQHGFSEEIISAYKKRVEGIKTYYDRGLLKMKLPEGFQQDESPFTDGDSD